MIPTSSVPVSSTVSILFVLPIVPNWTTLTLIQFEITIPQIFIQLFLERRCPQNQCRLPLPLSFRSTSPLLRQSSHPLHHLLSHQLLLHSSKIWSFQPSQPLQSLPLQFRCLLRLSPSLFQPLRSHLLHCHPFRSHLGFQPRKLMSSNLLLVLSPRHLPHRRLKFWNLPRHSNPRWDPLPPRHPPLNVRLRFHPSLQHRRLRLPNLLRPDPGF
jgi:hypothetical protein